MINKKPKTEKLPKIDKKLISKVSQTDVITNQELESLIIDTHKDDWHEFKKIIERCVVGKNIEVIRKNRLILDESSDKINEGGFGCIFRCSLKHKG